jgi:hypothetical protein
VFVANPKVTASGYRILVQLREPLIGRFGIVWL